jgi:outer membrane protein W
MKKLLFAFFLLTITLNMVANPAENLSIFNSIQKKKKKKDSAFDRTRLLAGGGGGFGAGFRAFSINVTPSIAYCFTDNFNIGTTIGFNYYQQAEDFQYFNTTTNQVTDATFKYKYPGYSFSIFARYLIAERFMLNFEPEMTNVKVVKNYSVNSTNGKVTEDKYRLNISSVLAGIGYIQKLSDIGYSYVMVCYDLTQNPNARYYQTFDYRAGIMMNLFNR